MTNAHKPGRLLTIPKAAKSLGLDHRTLGLAVEAGDVRVVQLHNRRYVPRSEVDRLVRDRE
jgi:hypothetical protein